MAGKLHEAQGRRAKLAKRGSIPLLLISTGKFTSGDIAAITKITQHAFEESTTTLSMVYALCDAPI